VKEMNPFLALVVIILGSFAIVMAGLALTNPVTRVEASAVATATPTLETRLVDFLSYEPDQPGSNDNDVVLQYCNDTLCNDVDALRISMPRNQFDGGITANKGVIFTSEGKDDLYWVDPNHPTKPVLLTDEVTGWTTSKSLTFNDDDVVWGIVVARSVNSSLISEVIFIDKHGFRKFPAPELTSEATRWVIGWSMDNRYFLVAKMDSFYDPPTAPTPSNHLWIYDTQTTSGTTALVKDWHGVSGLQFHRDPEYFDVLNQWNPPYSVEPFRMPYQQPVTIDFCDFLPGYCRAGVAESSGENFHFQTDVWQPEF
jgi:hypothetical protein